MSTLKEETIKEQAEKFIANMGTKLNQNVPLLQKSFIRVLGYVQSGAFKILYKYCGNMFLQMFPAYADIRETEILGQKISPLKEHGRKIGIGDPAPATQAQLLVQATVINQNGSILNNTALKSSTNGVTYVTIGEVILSQDNVELTIKAVSDQSGGGGAGSIGNLEAGDTLDFVNPQSNIDSVATVLSQIVTGADAESTEDYRQRIMDRTQKRPQGGAYADYETWAEAVEGVINAYPYTGEPGVTNIYIEATAESSGNDDGIPTTAQLQEVVDYIENVNIESGLSGLRPTGAFVNALAITRKEFTIEVQGLSVTNEASVRSSIENAIEEYLFSAEPFIPGLSLPPRSDIISRSAIAGLVSSIVRSENGIFTTLTLNDGGANIETYELEEGEKAKLATNGVTFI